jgi:hypothetical protein
VQLGLLERRENVQAMSVLRRGDIEAIVEAKLAEGWGLQCTDVDAVASKTFLTMLVSPGIEYDDRRDIRADLHCLRRWRKKTLSKPRAMHSRQRLP